MRPRSIVGPLILLLVGVLFLVNNLRPELPWLNLIGTYWPFLLIGWGVLRLMEIFFWRIRGRATGSMGLSGGEWVLILFIVVIGSSVFTAQRWWGNRGPFIGRGLEMFGESFDYPVSTERATGKTPRIVIENLRGNVRVVGTNEDKVKVTGRKTIRSIQKTEADGADRDCPIEITSQGDQIVIRTSQERVSGQTRVSADLDINVPRGASIEGRGRFGDFDITDITGNAEINSDNAGVRMQNIGGNVRVNLRLSDMVRATRVKGSVLVDVKKKGEDVELDNIEGETTLTGTYVGDLQIRNIARKFRFSSPVTEFEVQKVPGQVRIDLGDLRANNVAGPVHLAAHSRSRDVQITDFTESADISTDRGSIELRPARGASGRINARIKNGDIDIALPNEARFTLSATTSRGEIQNEFGAPLRLSSEGRGASLAGSVGQGPSVTLSTDRGSITVRKAGAEQAKGTPPPPPAPPAAPGKLPAQVERQ